MRGRFCGLQAPGRLLGQDGPSLRDAGQPDPAGADGELVLHRHAGGGEELELLDVGVLAVVGLGVARFGPLGVWALVFMASR